MIQLAISESGYLAALEKLLSRSGGWEVSCVELPDPGIPSVMVMDDQALARMPKPLAHPELVVLVTHNDPERLHEAWEAGIRSVVFYNDPVSTAVLAIMAASLRIPRNRPGGGSSVGTSPRGSVSCMGESSRKAARSLFCATGCDSLNCWSVAGACCHDYLF